MGNWEKEYSQRGYWAALETSCSGDGWAAGDGRLALHGFLQAPNLSRSSGTLALPSVETREECCQSCCCCLLPRFPRGHLGPSLQSCPWTAGDSASSPSKAPTPAPAGSQPMVLKGPCPRAASLQCPHPRHRSLLSPGRMWPLRGDPKKQALVPGQPLEANVRGTKLPWPQERCLPLKHL